MKHLATITDADIFDGATNLDPTDFFVRTAARAIVTNDKGEVYLLHITRDAYHKLPGGGIDYGEDVRAALQRELFEEIGCPAEVVGEVGEILEYRNDMKWKQTSYCFIAKQSGELVPNNLEQDEIDEGAEIAVAKNIDDAIRLLEADATQHYEGKFIQQRDLVFLRAAKELI